MIEKRIIVVHGMTGRQMPVKIVEGARPPEILRRLNIKDHRLSRVTGREPLPEDADVASVVQDGERLFALPHMEVGGGFSNFFAALFGTQPKEGKTEAAATPPPVSSLQRVQAVASVSSSAVLPRVPAARAVVTPAPPPPRALAVQPAERVFVLNELHEQPAIPYWQLRKWRSVGENLYLGHFKTPFGRCHGVIRWCSKEDFSFYIHDVPQALLDGPHGRCFAEVKPGKFRVHFSQAPSDINSGIFYIETLLTEAFEDESAA